MSTNPKARSFEGGPPASESGIDFYSWPTPNGLKINVALEELADLGTAGLSWKEHRINISKDEQKQPWFLAEVNPNGRIPAIIDRSKNDTRVFETGAILLYLSRTYDKEYKLHFEDDKDEAEMWSWVFFQHGGYGPMAGQAGHFLNAAPVKDVYAARRYIDESKRLLQVYEGQLAGGGGEGRDYLVGEGRGKFSYADIASFTWIRAHPYSLGLPSLASAGFPAVDAWVRRIEARPGAAKAVSGDMIEKLKADDGWEDKVRDKAKWVWEDEPSEKRKRDEL
ncbi:glutathione S-transferase [Rhodotorula diobovata]|uniref:Glutathione S-transferase n=1 Tax=Rhodotorula diobovata TaxID=5288 RepID=A0A5C5FV33_9BASI|nr:glutathione S-transferase [Rhodotorula diobovata]